MNAYINATILEMLERVKALKTKLPTDAPDCFHQLMVHCNTEIDNIISVLEDFINNPKYQVASNLRRKLIDFQEEVRYIDYLENQIVAPLHRWDPDDLKFTKLIQKVCKEICFPLIPPVASRLTFDYYCINTKFNHIRVPLLEAEFLLHMPDLYHELGHQLIATSNNPRIDKYQEELCNFMNYVEEYFRNEIVIRKKNNGIQEAEFLDLFLRSWNNWAIELFCDLFAVYTLGVVYGWANLHLCIKRGANPYQTPIFAPNTHPADASRMEAIFIGLDLIGETQDAVSIKEYWKKYLYLSNGYLDANYKMAYPIEIIKECAIRALVATRGIKCQIYNPDVNNEIGKLLHEAWTKFIQNPQTYISWERSKRDVFNS